MEGIIVGKQTSIEAKKIVTREGLTIEEVIFMMNGGYTETVDLDENGEVVMPFTDGKRKKQVIRMRTDKQIIAEIHSVRYANSGLNWSISNVHEADKFVVEVLRDVIRIVPKKDLLGDEPIIVSDLEKRG